MFKGPVVGFFRITWKATSGKLPALYMIVNTIAADIFSCKMFDAEKASRLLLGKFVVPNCISSGNGGSLYIIICSGVYYRRVCRINRKGMNSRTRCNSSAGY